MRSMLHMLSELCGFLLKNYTSMIMNLITRIKQPFDKKIKKLRLLICCV